MIQTLTMDDSQDASINQCKQDKVELIKCDVCASGNENGAEQYCAECNMNMCPSCEQYHNKFLKDHKLVTSFEGRTAKLLDLTVNCLHHNKIFSLYCRECNVNICSLCHTENHNGHKFSNMDEHAKVLKTDLRGLVHKLERCSLDIEFQSENLERHRSHFDNINDIQIKLVEAETSKLRAELEAQSTKLIKDLKGEKDTAHTVLNDQIKNLRGMRRDIDNLKTSIKIQINIAPDAGMLQFFNQVNSNLESKVAEMMLTLPNPSTFTSVIPGGQLLVGTILNTGDTYKTFDPLGEASNVQVTIEAPTEQRHTPVHPPPTLRQELSVMQQLPLGDYVVGCTADGSDCWVGVNEGDNSGGEVLLINRHWEQLLKVHLLHLVDYMALTTTGDLLVSGYHKTTKVTRVNRGGHACTFADIAAQGVQCVHGLCTTQQDDVFVCIRMEDSNTKDKLIKMSAQGEQILQVSQHLFASDKLMGIHKISRDTFCVQDGSGSDQFSRLVFIDDGCHPLRYIDRTGDLQMCTLDITGDRHGYIIGGTVPDECIRVYTREGKCIRTYQLPGSRTTFCISVGENDVMYVGTQGKLIVAKYLE